MAAADLLDIWNDALINIGAKTSLSDLTEQSAEAAACALRYPGLVRKIVRDTDWNCLRRRVALDEALTGAVWAPSWAYMYVYPEDCFCIRGFDLGLPGVRVPNWSAADYEVADDAAAGKVILMNITGPVMIYTSYALDLVDGTYEAKFDASLREAMGWALAAAIAGPLTGNAPIIASARGEAARSLADARAANANESAPNSMDAAAAESLTVRGYDDCWPWGPLRINWPTS